MQWRIDEELVGVGEHTQTHNTTGCKGDTGEGFGGARHGAPMLILALGSFVLGGWSGIICARRLKCWGLGLVLELFVA